MTYDLISCKFWLHAITFDSNPISFRKGSSTQSGKSHTDPPIGATVWIGPHRSDTLQPKPGTIIAETLQCFHCSECIVLVLYQVDLGDPMHQDLDYPFGSSKICKKNWIPALKRFPLPSQKSKESSSNPQCFRYEAVKLPDKKHQTTRQKLHSNWWGKKSCTS